MILRNADIATSVRHHVDNPPPAVEPAMVLDLRRDVSGDGMDIPLFLRRRA